MEQQNKGTWKKVFSKGAFAVVCIIVAVLLLVGAAYLTLRLRRSCARGSAVSEATPTPAATPLPDRVYPAEKKPAVLPPLEKLNISAGHLEDYTEALTDLEYWIDLTPDGAEGYTVVRNWALGCSFVEENGEYYRLGEGEDGKGVVDVLAIDLDFDGEKDLLYTYNYGANEDVYSKVGWFRFDTHESVFSDFAQRDGFLSLVEEDGIYWLFRAVRDADLETGTFGLTLTERLGEITESDGRILLLMDAPPEASATPAAE